MADEQQLTAAKCRTCGRQLTIDEFRACTGIGHFCSNHRPTGAPERTRSATRPKPQGPRPPGNRRGRRVSESGVIEYSCKAQFARNGVTRSGRLTTDHPSCIGGAAVFVYDSVGYGPGEIATLFIKDPEGRSLAQRSGFHCHG
jgi:hypothetical protein